MRYDEIETRSAPARGRRRGRAAPDLLPRPPGTRPRAGGGVGARRPAVPGAAAAAREYFAGGAVVLAEARAPGHGVPAGHVAPLGGILGQTISYASWRGGGRPAASRAVGAANGANPLRSWSLPPRDRQGRLADRFGAGCRSSARCSSSRASCVSARGDAPALTAGLGPSRRRPRGERRRRKAAAGRPSRKPWRTRCRARGASAAPLLLDALGDDRRVDRRRTPSGRASSRAGCSSSRCS